MENLWIPARKGQAKIDPSTSTDLKKGVKKQIRVDTKMRISQAEKKKKQSSTQRLDENRSEQTLKKEEEGENRLKNMSERLDR